MCTFLSSPFLRGTCWRSARRGWVLFCTVGLLCIAGTAGAQPDTRLAFERFNMERGLSSYSITSLLQDRQGFLWVGTIDGLNRFDGHTFTVYKHDPHRPHSISHNYVKVGALYEDRSGMLWVGTAGGLNRMEPATETFFCYQHIPGDPHSLSHDNVLAVAETRDGVLFVGTQNGLNRFDPVTERFTRYLYHPEEDAAASGVFISSIEEDQRGHLWLGTWGQGVVEFDPIRETFTYHRHDPNDPRSLSHDHVQALSISRAGHLLVGTLGGGLNVLDVATGVATRYQHRPGDPSTLSNDQVLTIREDRSGIVWIGTWGGGLNRFEPRTGRFSAFTSDLKDRTSLPNDQVFALLEDRSGALWVGTWNGLAHVLARQPFEVVSYRADGSMGLSHPTVSAVFEDSNGEVWVGLLGGGLNRWDRRAGTITHYTPFPASPGTLSDGEVSSIVVDHRGALWVATRNGGLNVLDRETGVFVQYHPAAGDTTSLSSNLLYTVFEDSRNVLWVSTLNQGLNKFDRARNRFVRYRNQPGDSTSLSHDSIWPLYEDHLGTFWVGSYGGGLNKFDRHTGTVVRYRYDPEDPYSLSSDRAVALQEDLEGRLWIGVMDGGLNRFDRKTERFYRYGTSNGLPHMNVACIVPDDAGHLWISTSGGLAKFDPRTETFTNYGISDGLPSATFYAACHKGRSGELYFGSAEGLVIFHPDSIHTNTHRPPVVITGFQLFNRPAALDSSITHIRQITLPYKENFIAFEFAALDFTDPLKNQYRYRLEGLDENWIDARGRRYAGYPNLQPGAYTFRVLAANNDGLWNREGASVRVLITPPYWQTWWFRLLIVTLVVGVLTLAYQYRIYHLLQVERTRQRIAQDLHDDLSGQINGIALWLQSLGRSERFTDDDRAKLLDLWQQARNLLDNLRHLIWIVDTEKEHLADLVERMESSVDQIFPDGQAHFEGPPAIPNVSLGMELRRNLLLIYKEALHNAARHAHAKKIHIRVAYAQDTLSFSVEDNGVGFDPTRSYPGDGLRNLRDRAKKIGATLQVDSWPGNGTTVRLSVKTA